MDDVTPTDDWAAVLQERFLSDLMQAEASAQLTAGERACLQQVMELQPGEVHRLMIAAEGGPAADLAGFFIVLQANNKALSVFMFSPVAGLENLPTPRPCARHWSSVWRPRHCVKTSCALCRSRCARA